MVAAALTSAKHRMRPKTRGRSVKEEDLVIAMELGKERRRKKEASCFQKSHVGLRS